MKPPGRWRVDLSGVGHRDAGGHARRVFRVLGDGAAEADEKGRWRIDLEPLKASGEGRTFRVRGDESDLEFSDVLVGEVWIGAGQSNMQYPMSKTEDGKAAIPAARHPRLRLFKRPVRRKAPERWTPCTPEAVADFSAVAYFFGKHLHEELDMPVGIIVRAVGGTTIQRAHVDAADFVLKKNYNRNI